METETRKVEQIKIAKLRPHPKNPRVMNRLDVIESIKQQIIENKAFPIEHAIIVRPHEEGYQIISGHQRMEAAKEAGLNEIPCWIKEMDDDTAFMQLILSNAQGELKPLEIGIHALHAVPKEEGGRGKKGGLSAYAEKIGKPQPNVLILRNAARVFQTIKPIQYYIGLDPDQKAKLADKAFHLAAIHKAPEEAWEALAEAMMTKDEEGKAWSVKDTEEWVNKVNKFDIPEEWQEIFLPYIRVLKHFLSGAEFSARTVNNLCTMADSVMSMIESHGEKHKELSEKAKKQFIEWLRENSEDDKGDAWDYRKIRAIYDEIEMLFRDEEENLESKWIHGDCLDHIKDIKDGSIHLLLTDPPYGISFQSGHRKVKKKKIQGDDIEDTLDLFSSVIENLMPKLSDNSHVLCFCNWINEDDFRQILEYRGLKAKSSIVWVKNNTSMGDLKGAFAPKHERIIHAVKGDPVLYRRESDVLNADRVPPDTHPTEKPVDLLKQLIEVTTVEKQLVVDPFGGVASVMVAAKQCNREYWGCEVDEEYHAKGMERLLECTSMIS